MLDISRAAGVDRSANSVVRLENGNSADINNAAPSSAKKYCTMRRSPSTEELRDYAHRLCRDYLHGTWLTIQSKDMIFKKVSGGLSNLLYYCALPEHIECIGTEPRRLLLRLYGQVNSERAIENLITESVIFALLSETQRGPRLFGVFSGGRLEEFIEARPLKTSELTDPILSTLIAEKMAQIHLMDVPLNKQPKWLWQTMERWIDQLQHIIESGHVSQVSRDMISSIKRLDLSNEYLWLKEYLMSIKSPVVFCHNDLQEGNILLRDGTTYDDNENNSNNNFTNTDQPADILLADPRPTSDASTTADSVTISRHLTSDKLVIIDYEYCSYNYRGFDFANHFCEWTYDYSNQDAPYFWNIEENRPTNKQMEHFIKNYLKCLTKHPEYKRREEDTVDGIMREVAAFTLASHFFWALWSVINATTSEITFDYWSYGKSRFKDYYRHKSQLMDFPKNQQNNNCTKGK